MYVSLEVKKHLDMRHIGLIDNVIINFNFILTGLLVKLEKFLMNICFNISGSDTNKVGRWQVYILLERSKYTKDMSHKVYTYI